MRHSARVNARIRYSKIATCTVLSLNEYSTFSVSPTCANTDWARIGPASWWSHGGR
ncbi:hypothetical protein T440DRAFT_52900 [Plenodomus tracheiphilus IPT5]|uniref:Uncharacterized protein n=1 Tax=Plenodomus tracheiphilus IPT5 TaxID=1408161 RepID=A0A6A7ALU9_9PLEO|nr:hypothetical protein T440DRAFT_52900 [Plenodomus tracheiphilus IPT5]